MNKIGMNKRIHTRRSTNLICRNYLLHFKWPLTGSIFIFILFLCNEMYFSLVTFPPNELENRFDISYNNVIYPSGILNSTNLNTSILYYLARKDKLKVIDDRKSLEKKQKVVLPLIKNKSSSNSYLILEFTHVFGKPRFCSYSREEIFGKTCPYTNWYVR